jgi:hypothetical protein
VTDDQRGPWAKYGDGMGWEHPALKPGFRAHLARMEALERAELEREEAERRERADDRIQAWAMRRMTEKTLAGEPFDPNDLRTLVEPVEVLAERVFAQQDAHALRMERRAMIEAGLLADLGPSFGDGMGKPAEEGSVGDATSSAGGGMPAVARSMTRSKITEWRHRLARSAVPCQCVDCVKVRVARARGE